MSRSPRAQRRRKRKVEQIVTVYQRCRNYRGEERNPVRVTPHLQRKILTIPLRSKLGGDFLYSEEDMDFKTIWKKGSKNPFRGVMLSLDPGHTTGYALWLVDSDGPVIGQSGQVRSWSDDDLQFTDLHNLIKATKVVVMESYQVYDWKKDEHSWSQIPTVQVIGSIKTLCQLQAKPYYSQTAQVAKQFVTDEKLEQWGMWKKGERHARDAIRHGCYWLLFNKG